MDFRQYLENAMHADKKMRIKPGYAPFPPGTMDHRQGTYMKLVPKRGALVPYYQFRYKWIKPNWRGVQAEDSIWLPIDILEEDV